MEVEVFEIIVAVNKMKDVLSRVEKKVDFLARPISEQLNRKYLDSDQAAANS